jgi:group I intron endonuclease
MVAGKTACVYAFIDENNTPYYIGQTLDFNSRLRKHKHYISKSTKPYYRKANKMIQRGIEFRTQILESDLTAEQAKQKEIEYIEKFKKAGVKLYNLTDGGDGSPSYSHTEEAKIKIGKASEGRKHPCSEEIKEKIRKTLTGYKHTEEHKRNSILMRGEHGMKKYKGKTWEEIYGVEWATMMRNKRAKKGESICQSV